MPELGFAQRKITLLVLCVSVAMLGTQVDGPPPKAIAAYLISGACICLLRILSLREKPDLPRSKQTKAKPPGSQHRSASARLRVKLLRGARRIATLSRAPEIWVPPTRNVRVAGLRIGGMTYLATDTGNQSQELRIPEAIDPTSPVASKADPTPRLNRLLDYASMSPSARATYLNWLATGRNDISVDPKYMLLYFSGLERRLLIDEADDDAGIILDEVNRLQNLYPAKHVVQRIFSRFLDAVSLKYGSEEISPGLTDLPDLPAVLKFRFGAQLADGRPLRAEDLFIWFMNHPERRLRTPALRCAEEFEALFKLRFDARFPDGLTLKRPRKLFKVHYKSASGSFSVSMTPEHKGTPVPDISGLRQPVEIAQEISDDVADDLDKLSRFLGRSPDGRASAQAHALLPPELWVAFPNPVMASLKAWASDLIVEGGFAPASDVFTRLNGAAPDKLNKRQITEAVTALARINIGMAPDPRFALRGARSDEPVALYRLETPPEAPQAPACPDIRSFILGLAAGTYIARSDGQISERDAIALRTIADQETIPSDQERPRLRAELEWLIAVPIEWRLLRRRLGASSTTDHERLQSILDVFVKQRPTSSRADAIERVYRAGGLDPELARRSLTSARAPACPKLDSIRIAQIQSDTDQVSKVLASVFHDAVPEQPSKQAASSDPAGLDEALSSILMKTIGFRSGNPGDFSQEAETHGRLALGAMEAINDWSFEQYGAQLIGDAPDYPVDAAVAAAILKDIHRKA
ncbi:MAG: hypothetical protein CSA72_02650 [Rhodobacterales bacterium]|nr:MAG: hypothetical protein CSA72_02650 [Rhodobacterales bacterium]